MRRGAASPAARRLRGADGVAAARGSVRPGGRQRQTAVRHGVRRHQSDGDGRRGRSRGEPAELTEADVAPLLAPDDIAKWDNAIANIDAYVASLTALTAPNPANDFGTAATALGTAVAKLEPSALPSPGVAAGFAELGRLLIEAKAERDALKIARQADPAMQHIFTAMADVIGDTKLKGLRGTVHEHWQTEIAEVAKVDFPTAKGNTAARRSAVLAYVDLCKSATRRISSSPRCARACSSSAWRMGAGARRRRRSRRRPRHDPAGAQCDTRLLRPVQRAQTQAESMRRRRPMATTTADATTTKNEDLDQLHDMLIAANEQLNSSLDDTDDPDIAKATITEMREVVHRIDLVQACSSPPPATTSPPPSPRCRPPTPR